MSDFLTDAHLPLFFDLTDGFMTSIDTGSPMYKCFCGFYWDTTDLCKDCDTFPKRAYMGPDGMIVLVDASIV
jgi:hypothetical protein